MKSYIHLFLVAVSSCRLETKDKNINATNDISKNSETVRNIRKEKCPTIFMESLYFYKAVQFPTLTSNSNGYILHKGEKLIKISIPNPIDKSLTDTLYRFVYKESLAELVKAYDERNIPNVYSGWNRIVIRNKEITLANGLRVGGDKRNTFRLLNHSILSCDTIQLNTEDGTYDNFLVFRNDTLKEISLAITAD